MASDPRQLLEQSRQRADSLIADLSRELGELERVGHPAKAEGRAAIGRAIDSARALLQSIEPGKTNDG